MSAGGDILAFAHIGDLHLTNPKERNYADFLAIVAEIEMACAGQIDFVVLPGDNADNGLPAQYALAATALKMLSVPVHAIPGDHDMEQGSLAAFHAALEPGTLPKALTVRGIRCLFLDISGGGAGGPDFRIGSAQAAWIENELRAMTARGETGVVFMHSYPADLQGEGEADALNALFETHGVALVDLGHTHYNELANDAGTIFAATRSTGQIEEGPVGYALATLDEGVVSWRFKPLDDAFPLVIVTSPADHRLMRGPHQAIEDTCLVRALVLGREPIVSAQARIGEGDWTPMERLAGGRGWVTRLAVPDGDPRPDVTVRATDVTGRPGQHSIRAAGRGYRPPERGRSGSDAASIGAWPENGIFGTQLGPNRNGKPSS